MNLVVTFSICCACLAGDDCDASSRLAMSTHEHCGPDGEHRPGTVYLDTITGTVWCNGGVRYVGKAFLDQHDELRARAMQRKLDGLIDDLENT
ncbi:MAG: hypothetical protein VW239_06800 [Candidatus Nanopelagicales bacterium]